MFATSLCLTEACSDCSFSPRELPNQPVLELWIPIRAAPTSFPPASEPLPQKFAWTAHSPAPRNKAKAAPPMFTTLHPWRSFRNSKWKITVSQPNTATTAGLSSLLLFKKWGDFSNAAGIPRPDHLPDQYGFSLGGPIWKQKTFFFVDFEKVRDNVAVNFSGNVPTADERLGNFSADITNIYNPSACLTHDPTTGAC